MINKNLLPHLHQVHLEVSVSGGSLSYSLNMNITCDSATPFTFSTLKSYLDGLSYQDNAVRITLVGYYKNTSLDASCYGATSTLARVGEKYGIALGNQAGTFRFTGLHSWADLFGTPSEFNDRVD